MKIPAMINVASLITHTNLVFANASIDDPANMKNQQIYLFSGTSDATVVPGVMKALDAYCR
jgi:hypothetical protein